MPERNLDQLRAIAVLCVLLAHVLYQGTRTARPLELGPYIMIGRAGVLIFFVRPHGLIA